MVNSSEAKKENADVDRVFSERLFSFAKLCDGFYLLEPQLCTISSIFVPSFFLHMINYRIF